MVAFFQWQSQKNSLRWKFSAIFSVDLPSAGDPAGGLIAWDPRGEYEGMWERILPHPQVKACVEL